MSSPVLRTVAAMEQYPSRVGPVLVAISHDRVILEYPLTLPGLFIETSREKQEAMVVPRPPPGTRNCRHSGLSVEELPLDLEHEEISDVQLQVNTVLFWPIYTSRIIKHSFLSWSVDVITAAGTGRGSTISHSFPCKTSTTSNSSSFESRPPATTKTSGDVVLTEDVSHLLVGIGGSEGSHCRPVVLVRSRLVGSRVEGRRPPTNTNLDW